VTQTLFGWDLPGQEPDPNCIYTCTVCGQRHPLPPMVATVDQRWWYALCNDCGKRRVFTMVRRKETPSRDSNDTQQEPPPEKG
jgi:DNA-directed RNA polymerase subunit RPC12/RpoP